MTDTEREAEMKIRVAEALLLAMDGDFLPCAGMSVDNVGQDVPLDQARPKEVAWWAAATLAPLFAEVAAHARHEARAAAWDEGHGTSNGGCVYWPDCAENGHHVNPYREATGD